jgi:hypothetical protein
MEIIVEIHKGEDGRPAGTVRGADEARGRSFSGNLEFLGLVEELYLAEPSGALHVSCDDAVPRDDKPERTEQ